MTVCKETKLVVTMRQQDSSDDSNTESHDHLGQIRKFGPTFINPIYQLDELTYN